MENEIIIRPVRSNDFDGLVKLYNEVWPDVTYDKVAKTNFVLNESEGYNFCAEKDGEIVGSRTSFLMNFFYGDRYIKCIHVGDSCTRSDCRGKGLFGKMNCALLAEFFGPANGELIWNISVPASRRVYEKCGWNYIESLGTLLCVCRPFHIISQIGFSISKILGAIDWDLNDDVKPIAEQYLIARENIMQNKRVLHVNYDRQTIEWRMKTKSGIKTFWTSDGMIYYKIGKKNKLTFVLVGEIFLKDYTYSTYKRLMNSFKKSLRPDLVKVAISLGHPILPFYKKYGFFYNPKNKFLNHGVRVENDEMKRICYNPNNWAISMLDVDTF